jgi:hypothetical protein
MHSVLDIEQGNTNWASNSLNIVYSGSHAVKDGLIIAGYNVSWGRTVCLLPQDMPIIQTSKDICQTVSCEEGGCKFIGCFYTTIDLEYWENNDSVMVRKNKKIRNPHESVKGL